jgi:hypothetical protein
MPAVVVTAALAVSVLGTSAAEAKPTKPGTPTVTASATEPSIGTYDVDASWTAVSGATSYRASVIRSGSTLTSATLSGTAWHPHVSATPGQQLTVSVKAVVNRQPGRSGTRTFTLTDQISPTGSFSSTFVTDTGAATVTQDSLVDDSPVAGVTRTVTWGDGSLPEVWTSGTTIDHQYPLVAARYEPTVKLEDASHHVTVVTSSGVVVQDDTAPTGTYSAAPGAAWAKLTQVTLTQTAIHDVWSDGSAPEVWTSGDTLSHVYAVAGGYTPHVTLTDEAGNAATFDGSLVTVTADTAAPTVKLTLPRRLHSVKAWRTLRGKATDAGTGVKSVVLKAVEKRGHAWYGYRPASHTWGKATTKAKAFAKARAFRLTTGPKHGWTATLARLRKGTLVYKVRATDQVGNASVTLSHLAKLTRR